jgi:hypothetical protein
MRRYLSYANITATLALVFAMSGGALAAKHYLVTKTNQISPKVLKSFASSNTSLFKKLSKTVTVTKASSASSAASATNAVNAANATHALSANTATTAGSAGSASTATTASTASNALALGGTPASGFTRSDCNSRTGQVKGFVTIASSAGVPSSFTPVAEGYNCSGQPVEVKRLAEGSYVVRFVGSPAGIAVATVNAERGGGTPVDLAAVTSLAPGEWRVTVFNVLEAKKVDDAFELVSP